VKEVGSDGLVASTLDRTRLWLVQTPQVFRRDLLAEAYAAAARDGVSTTDDAGLVERLGHPVRIVRGDPDNIKITWPEDVARSEQWVLRDCAAAARTTTSRSGIGYDAHAFAEDRPLVLAGVRLRGERGLLGHSDADVVCHAICDALLGAVAAGDIGRRFPDSDPRYSGISSLSLLTDVSLVVRRAGWEIENVDAIVIAEEPHIAPFIPDMRRALASAMGVDCDRVNLKGKTTEGMGFTGRREGIASQAIAVLRSADDAHSDAKSEE
jgi:2-C-methyl-D-erythritol 2,4-cyclodiphosphate synthase